MQVQKKLREAFPDKRVELFYGELDNKIRSKLIRDYNKQKIHLFLISKAGGLGINLMDTQAFHNLDPFENEASRDQTVARCLRMNSYPDKPRPGRNNFLTEITYLSILPNLNGLDSQLSQLDKMINDQKLNENFPNPRQRLMFLKKFFKDNYSEDNGQSVDEKIYKRCIEKQRSINPVLRTLQLMGTSKSKSSKSSQSNSKTETKLQSRRVLKPVNSILGLFQKRATST